MAEIQERVVTCEHPPDEHNPILGCMFRQETKEDGAVLDCRCCGDGSACGPAAKENETNEQGERYPLSRGD